MPSSCSNLPSSDSSTPSPPPSSSSSPSPRTSRCRTWTLPTPPPLFSRITLFVILLLWFVIACITSLILVGNSYSTSSSLTTTTGGSTATERWVMMGGLTSTSVHFRIRALLDDFNEAHGPSSVELVVATDPDLADVIFLQDLAMMQRNGNNNNTLFASDMISSGNNGSNDRLVYALEVNGLTADTVYYYGVVSSPSPPSSSSAAAGGTTTIEVQGHFRTAPTTGQRSNFRIAASACAWSGSNAKVFETLYNRQQQQEKQQQQQQQESAGAASGAALMFLHLGDFHYGDLTTDSIERRLQEIDNVMSSQRQKTLWSNIPISYMWDDHDWLDNNSGGDPSQPGYDAALQSYSLAFPHYQPLPSVEWNTNNNNTNFTNNGTGSTFTETTVGMYHAFTIGTVRFIISDLRSEATGERVYSSIQRDWLFGELEQSTEYDYVVWVSTRPWIGERKDGSDTWAGYDDDRRALSDHIRQVVTKRNLLVLSADSHMVAFDDGSHTYYGSEHGEQEQVSFPILQTGPLDRLGSLKGGPYSDGCHTYKFERNHQYSVIEFNFDRSRRQLAEEEFGDTEDSCINIRSYDNDHIIFERQLCGPDIFSPVASSNDNVGSCSEQLFSPTNTALACIAGFLLLVSIVMTSLIFSGCWSKFILSFMIFVMFSLTFGAGIAIPLLKGISQYDAFETILICLLQMLNCTIYLVCWKYYSVPKLQEEVIMKDPIDTTEEQQ